MWYRLAKPHFGETGTERAPWLLGLGRDQPADCQRPCHSGHGPALASVCYRGPPFFLIWRNSPKKGIKSLQKPAVGEGSQLPEFLGACSFSGYSQPLGRVSLLSATPVYASISAEQLVLYLLNMLDLQPRRRFCAGSSWGYSACTDHPACARWLLSYSQNILIHQLGCNCHYLKICWHLF